MIAIDSIQKSFIDDFLHFLNESPTPFHVVNTVRNYLCSAGFKELKETECWEESINIGNNYFVIRNTTSIIAFNIGKDWKPGDPLILSGTHTDSPSLKIKPISRRSFEEYLQVSIETYGGGIWHSWFDRDLGLAGCVMVREKDGNIKQHLVNIHKSILRIPTLAIHLDPEVNQKFEFNRETQLLPILGLELSKENSKNLSGNNLRHHSELLTLIAKELQIEECQIMDFELILKDLQPSCLGGINNEFILSGRLDDQAMCYSVLRGFLECLKSEKGPDPDRTIKLIAMFDHEEVGSVSAQGAMSTFLTSTLKRVFNTQMLLKHHDPISFEQSISKSFLISADMSHAIHPNVSINIGFIVHFNIPNKYPSKHDANHRPKLSKGLVLKVNSNQRYATNSQGIAIACEIANKAQVNLQFYINENTIPSGTTIGPLLSASLGIKTIDIGIPQLSMHSIREMGCTEDIISSIYFFKSYYENYADIQKTIKIN